MSNASNTSETTQPGQGTEVTDDAEAMDIVVETYDPRPSTVEAAEHPGTVEPERTGAAGASQGGGGAES